MSKGYKKEYIDKVKQKFNDLQPGGKPISDNIRESRNDSRGKVLKSCGVVKQG